ncbi:hypothetical protein [Microbacterium sp. zg-YB36]|uniref:hypothetical protein n=1 Tax=Microbacterium sp. zg-YB36 TaxID=2969407 RepID=UPI00214A8ED7|nr:hypothetical protein [Microbacterium sp. zg-YB36]MDL5352355.1 hypothetical protein [Microbacterium sp. zg-YB36]
MGNLGTAAALPTAAAGRAQRLVTMVVIAAALGAALVAMQPSPRAEAASPCGADITPLSAHDYWVDVTFVASG